MTAKCSSYMIRNGEVRNRGIRGAFGLITNFRRDRMRLYAGVSPRLILKTRLLMLIASFASLITTHDAIGAARPGGAAVSERHPHRRRQSRWNRFSTGWHRPVDHGIYACCGWGYLVR